MILPFLTVAILVSVPATVVLTPGLQSFFGIVIPYVAVFLFLFGILWRIANWAISPVPFNIPTVCGQQKSLKWIKQNGIESPWTYSGVTARMIMEIVFFRSLFRNERVELKRREKLVYGSSRYLWLGAIMFHWSLAIIVFRHMRFVTDPVVPGVGVVQSLDGFFQLGTPTLYITNMLITIALLFLISRRILSRHIRFISLYQDYFVLFLLTAIIVTGILMRLYFHPDLIAVKELIMNLVSFRPAIPVRGLSLLTYTHLFLVSVLVACFPFSKLMHAPGVFLSPTRNLRNDSRARRHINTWNYPVKVHTYEEYEEEFSDAMASAGLTLEKERASTGFTKQSRELNGRD